jgi:tape measure domain-containing protein
VTAEVIRIGIDARGARTGGQAVRAELGGIKREARGLQGQLVTTGRSLVNTRNLLLSLATASGLSQAVRMADTYKLLNARLRNVSDSARDAGRAYERLLAVSNRTRSDVEGSVALYSKLIMSGKMFGVTQERALVITENVNKALRISGASAIEAAAAQLQLSQAIASGTLQGDEFRSVLENAPRLAKALVESLNLKGGVGELRKLSREGKLTIDQLVKALTDAKISEKLEKEFSNIPLTVGQAMQVLKNQITDAIGDFDRLNYVTAGLSKAIVFFASNLDRIVKGAFPLLLFWLVRASGAGTILTRGLGMLGAMATGTGGRMAALGRMTRMYGLGAATAAAGTRALMFSMRALASVLLNVNVVLTAVITVLLIMATRQDLAGQAADRMGEREGRLANIIDFTTGKIRTQNAALLTNIKLKAMADMQKARVGFAQAQRQGLEVTGRHTGGFTPGMPWSGLMGKLFGGNGPLANSGALKGQMEAFFKTGNGGAALIKNLDTLKEKGQLSAKVWEQATKAIGAYQATALDYSQANAELRLLDGKANDRDKKLLGLDGIDNQPPITSPDLGKKTKDKKAKVDDLNARLEKAQANASKLADIMDRWDAEPKLVDQAAKDKMALDEMVGEWIEINGQVVKYTQAMADIAKGNIDKGLTRDLEKDLELGREALLVQALQLQGQDELAEATRRVLDYKQRGIPVDEKSYQQILNIVAAEKQLTEEMEKQQVQVGIWQGALGEVQQAFEQLLMDFKPKNFLKAIAQTGRQLQAKLISEKIFGPLYKQVEEMVTGKGGVKAANEYLAQQTTQSGNTLGDFNGAIINTTNVLGQVNAQLQAIANGAVPGTVSGTGETIGPNGEIIITAPRIPRGGTNGDIGPMQLFEMIFGSLTKPIVGGLEKLGVKLPKGIWKAFDSVMSAGGGAGGMALMAGFSALASGGFKKGRINDTLTDIAMAVAPMLPAPMQMGMAIATGLSKMLGIKNYAGGMFGIVGNLIGGALFGFKDKVPYGATTITGVDQTLTGRGNDSQARGAAVQAGGSVQDGLRRIADTLGGGLGSFNVTIGTRHGDWRVNVGGTSLKKKKGAKEFDDDAEGAVRYAIMEAIKQGAITGLRAGTQRLLASSEDLDQALEKALAFEGVFKDLARELNPAKFALDELNKKFTNLKSIFTQAGATAEEWGQLEQLYGLERKKLLEEQVSALKDFLDELKTDRSFKTAFDRMKDAETAFAAFEADIASGKVVDQEAYVDAGRRLQDLAREVYGSTPEFFAIHDRLLRATQGAIDIVNATNAGTENILVIRDAITTQTDTINGTLTQILGAIQSGGGGGGGGRGAFTINRY